MSPAPMSRTSDKANFDDNEGGAGCAASADGIGVPSPCLRASLASPLVMLRAGSRPERMPVRRESAKVKRETGPSEGDLSRLR